MSALRSHPESWLVDAGARLSLEAHVEAGRPAAGELDPALNPIPRMEAVRWVNGLPRTPRAPAWLEAPCSAGGPMMRRALLQRFLERVRAHGEPSAAAERMLRLLEERAALIGARR